MNMDKEFLTLLLLTYREDIIKSKQSIVQSNIIIDMINKKLQSLD